MSLNIIVVLFALYVIAKAALFYWANCKLKDLEKTQKNKIKHRRIRVREVRPDNERLPF